MNDQELYDFFKNRSDSFNEIPTAALWSRITETLDQSLQAAKSPKSKVTKKILLLVLVALLTALCALYLKKNTADQPINPDNPQKQSVATPTTIYKQEYTNTVQPNDTTVLNGSFYNQTQIMQPQKIQPVGISIKKDSLSTNSFKPFHRIKPENKSSDSTNEDLEIHKQVYKNRIVIRSKKQLSQTQFDSLKEKSLKENENSYGLLIIIMAKGHPVFRKQIPKPIQFQSPKPFVRILSIKQPEPVFYKGILTEKQDTLLVPANIVISTDTISLKPPSELLLH